MKINRMDWAWALALAVSGLAASAETKVVVERNQGETATEAFKFKNVPAPSNNDVGTKAKFTLVDGRRDPNGGDLDLLHNGRLPSEEDAPSDNFFFAQGADGGRLQVDLGAATEVRQVNTYSWHGSTRGPQVYVLYASDGQAVGFNAEPRKGTDPAGCGWKLLAKVDTRPKEGEQGGQYGVSIADTEGALGQYRYLLFDISKTEGNDPFGNTFFSEIDIVDPTPPQAIAMEPAAKGAREVVEAGDGKYQITIDTTDTPDLTEWAHNELVPVVREWYPKLVQMLPSEGYEAPKRISIVFNKSMGGVADTAGTRIRCAAKWMRQNLKGEAKGSIVHEMVHAVQQYGRVPRGATRPPGWVVEGLADYLRFYRYEPQTHGADITRRNVARARYDASYRTTANFLNWVSEKYDKDFATKLNASIREGKYGQDPWKLATQQTVQELGDLWKEGLEEKLAAQPEPASATVGAAAATPAASTPAAADASANTLTEAEKAAGWKLLFDGQNLNGWHNFKREGVRAGWQVKDGTLACVDPHNAGDIVTTEKFGWFELQIDYNISEGGNSGIMYHVTDQGGAAWATGPEFQLEDNVKAADPVRCGWLYALYQPPDDPKTGKPLDATKPAGQWNHIRLLISAEKCEHEINGVKYFEYVLASDDFKGRVAKSKFSGMPLFAKSDSGHLALQGDHGQVAFRNIKIRSIPAPK